MFRARRERPFGDRTDGMWQTCRPPVRIWILPGPVGRARTCDLLGRVHKFGLNRGWSPDRGLPRDTAWFQLYFTGDWNGPRQLVEARKARRDLQPQIVLTVDVQGKWPASAPELRPRLSTILPFQGSGPKASS